MNNTNVINYMHRAIMMAAKGMNNGEFPIGALIVHDGNILTDNYTQEQTQHRRIVHAEFLVLNAVDQLQPSSVERSEMVLFTTLEPCIMCLGAAMTFGIRTIYYALESPIDGASKLIPHYFANEEHHLSYSLPTIQGDILREQSIELFKQYITIHPNDGAIKWTKMLLETVS
jgi:tRNA(adenine34) deaminase